MLKVALMLSALVQAPAQVPPGGFTDQSDFADETETVVEARLTAPVPTMRFRDMSEFSDEAPLSISTVAFDVLFGGVLVMAALVLLGPIAGALYLVAWRNPMAWARGRLPRAP